MNPDSLWNNKPQEGQRSEKTPFLSIIFGYLHFGQLFNRMRTTISRLSILPIKSTKMSFFQKKFFTDCISLPLLVTSLTVPWIGSCIYLYFLEDTLEIRKILPAFLILNLLTIVVNYFLFQFCLAQRQKKTKPFVPTNNHPIGLKEETKSKESEKKFTPNNFELLIDEQDKWLEILPIALLILEKSPKGNFINAELKTHKKCSFFSMATSVPEPIHKLIGSSAWEQTKACWEKAFEGKSQEFSLLFNEVECLVRLNPCQEQSNEKRVIGSIQNISIFKNNNIKILSADTPEKNLKKSRETFLANMSHELRTPLNAILGYSQILERDAEWFSEIHRNGISVIKQSGEHLLNIINEILDFSKLNAGKTDLELKEFDLKAMVNQLKTMVEVRAREKALDFRVLTSKNLPYKVLGDEQKLKQVLINLLTNGIQFTESGSVILKIEIQDPTQFQFSVEDTGDGISREDHVKVFEAFHQIKTGKPRRSGTGLGLSISSKMVSLMGGRLEVKSEKGSGSCFSFKIKMQPVMQKTATEEQENFQIQGYEGDRKQILILGEDSQSRFLLGENLRRLNFRIIEAENPEEAKIRIKKSAPDLIILDCIKPLPQFSNFVEWVKNIDALLERSSDPNLQNPPSPTKMIAASVSIDPNDSSKFIEMGCDCFLQKPYNGNDLQDAVQSLLDIHWTQYQKQSLTKREHSSVQQKTYLDKELYKNFHLLSQKGDIRGIKNQALSLLKEREDYKQFAKKVLQLSEQFQINAIRDLIDNYAPGKIERES